MDTTQLNARTYTSWGRRSRTLVAAVVAALVVFGVTAVNAPETASAAKTVVKVVGSERAIWTTTNYSNTAGDKVTLSVIPQFRNHTATSVKVTTFKLCFSTTRNGGDYSVAISPMITDNRTGWARDWRYLTFESGSCRTYTVDRTFRKNGSLHMFRIEPRVSSAYIGGSTTAAYKR